MHSNLDLINNIFRRSHRANVAPWKVDMELKQTLFVGGSSLSNVHVQLVKIPAGFIKNSSCVTHMGQLQLSSKRQS